MIRMSKETDYGIVVLAYFASAQEGLKQNAREVAMESQLPLPMVRKILKILAREGLLISHRGAKGGYSLTRGGERISIAEIVTAIEGPLAMTECIEAPGECRHEPVCGIRTSWQKINQIVFQALNNMTLSDLTGPLPGPMGSDPGKLVSLQ
ncbi:MAG: SUF system Fe-S cluster assembly regulator [Acidobacteria bacterium]|nr:MAG: SUF system Fe-S cluster assembly regulator [Acidobacteriota bacterium]